MPDMSTTEKSFIYNPTGDAELHVLEGECQVIHEAR